MGRQTLVYIGDVLLPVPPEKISYKAQNQNKTRKLVNGEEINQVLPPGLSEITMEKILLPSEAYYFCQPNASGEVYSAAFLLKLFETLKKEKRTFPLIINNSSDGLCNDGHNEDGLYTLEDYTAVRSVDLNLDYEATLKFKEYVNYGVKTAVIATAASALSSAVKSFSEAVSKKKTVKKSKKRSTTKSETTEQTYTVKKGDTLWAIAKKFYGDGSLYPYLANLNGLKNANVINIGQVLRIGPKEDAEKYKGSTGSGSTSSGSKSSGTKNNSSGSGTSSTSSVGSEPKQTTSTGVDMGSLGVLPKDKDGGHPFGPNYTPATSGNNETESVVLKDYLGRDVLVGGTPVTVPKGTVKGTSAASSDSKADFTDYTQQDYWKGYKDSKLLKNSQGADKYLDKDKKASG